MCIRPENKMLTIEQNSTSPAAELVVPRTMYNIGLKGSHLKLALCHN